MDPQFPLCAICTTPYEHSLQSPMVLDCGHSACYACLYNLLQNESPCPKCRVPLSMPLDKYVVNFDLHRECENIRIAFRDIRNMLEKFQDFVSSGKSYLCYDDRIAIGKEKGKLRELIKETIKSINERASKNIEGAASAEIKEKVTVDSVGENIHRICEPQPRKFFCVDRYQNEEHFIYEICARLKNGEVIYACNIIHELCEENDYYYQWKYGKLSWAEGCMYIHCLSLSTVDENSTCVHLQDLKRCLEGREITAFFDVGTKKFRFTPVRSSYLTLQFLKFCTGEEGEMLKGSTARFNSEVENTTEKSEATDDAEGIKNSGIDTTKKSDEINFLSAMDTTSKSKVPDTFDKTNISEATDQSNISEVIDRPHDLDAINKVNISNTIHKLNISNPNILTISDATHKANVADASREKTISHSLTRTNSNSSDVVGESSCLTVAKPSDSKLNDPKNYCVFGVVNTQYQNRSDYDISIDSKKVVKNFEKEDLIIQCFHKYIYVQRVPANNCRYNCVVAKLQKDCEVKISDLKLKKIEDCGISFDVLIKKSDSS